MKKKQKPRWMIILVLIAALGGLGYYIHQSAGEAPVIPAPKTEHPSDPAPSAKSHPTAASMESRIHDSAQESRQKAPSQPEGEKFPASDKPSPKTTEPGPGVVTGTIRPPAHVGPGDTSPKTADPSMEVSSVPTEPEQRNDIDDFCHTIKSDMRELFSYLDRKNYILELNLEAGTYDRFRAVTAALSARPPVPAGEGRDTKLFLENVYHLYRALNLADIGLIKRILRHEHDEIEIYMDMLHRWLASGDRCPDHTGARPSSETVYLYGGFLLNSTGGRAVLFRRDTTFRILASYYCLLAVHQADMEKRNLYGIDIRPFIGPLREEMAYHPGLIFRDHYLARLDEMRGYYQATR